MKPYLSDPDFTLWNGDVRDVLRELPAESVDCALTSPPFFGLRDYGTGLWDGGDSGCDHKAPPGGGTQRDAQSGNDRGYAPGSNFANYGDRWQTSHYREVCGKCGARRIDRQIGLEATPDEWVAELVGVFREVRRVLRPAGTLWVECGDSYGAGSRTTTAPQTFHPGAGLEGKFAGRVNGGVKPKDLLGQPWMLAQALRGPWWVGRIPTETDRVWLAAIVDGEGSIAVNRLRPTEARTNTRKGDSYGPYLRVHNTSLALVERCREITGLGSVGCHDERRRPVYVWSVYGDSARDVLREIYPYLVVKQHEARLAYGFHNATAYEGLKALHQGSETTADAPAPPSCWEPGFYLRQCLIWQKPNAMPESVRDRCTTGHSYVFLLAKNPRYWFDADAISEGRNLADIEHAERYGANRYADKRNGEPLIGPGGPGSLSSRLRMSTDAARNARSVWRISTQGYAEAHFATWPEALVERILKAGCPEWVCGTCGKARERIVEAVPDGRKWTGQRADANDGLVRGYTPGVATSNHTIGWSDCGHGNYKPGVALDPFMGSGTTALVARRLGRHAVGVELSSEYCAMAARRLSQLSLLAEGAGAA